MANARQKLYASPPYYYTHQKALECINNPAKNMPNWRNKMNYYFNYSTDVVAFDASERKVDFQFSYWGDSSDKFYYLKYITQNNRWYMSEESVWRSDYRVVDQYNFDQEKWERGLGSYDRGAGPLLMYRADMMARFNWGYKGQPLPYKEREITNDEILEVCLAVRDSCFAGGINLKGRVLTQEMLDILAETLARKGENFQLDSDYDNNELVESYNQKMRAKENAMNEMKVEISDKDNQIVLLNSQLNAAQKQMAEFKIESEKSIQLLSQDYEQKLLNQNTGYQKTLKIQLFEFSELTDRFKEELSEANGIINKQMHIIEQLKQHNEILNQENNALKEEKETFIQTHEDIIVSCQNDIAETKFEYENRERVPAELSQYTLHELVHLYKNTPVDNAKYTNIAGFLRDKIKAGCESDVIRRSQLTHLNLIALADDSIVKTLRPAIEEQKLDVIFTVDSLIEKINGLNIDSDTSEAKLLYIASDALLQDLVHRQLPESAIDDLTTCVKEVSLRNKFDEIRNDFINDAVKNYLRVGEKYHQSLFQPLYDKFYQAILEDERKRKSLSSLNDKILPSMVDFLFEKMPDFMREKAMTFIADHEASIRAKVLTFIEQLKVRAGRYACMGAELQDFSMFSSPSPKQSQAQTQNQNQFVFVPRG